MADLQPDRPVRAALLKGRRHYLCLRRLHAWSHGHALSLKEMRLLARILIWLPHTHTGDVNELAIHDAQERTLLMQVTSDAAVCSEERCAIPATGLPHAPAWVRLAAVLDFYSGGAHPGPSSPSACGEPRPAFG